MIDGEEHDAAKELYAHIVKNYFLKDDDKWAFDIALDCVHNFTDEEVGIVQRQGEIGDYHFGYGMYVRNHYVYPSKLHKLLRQTIIYREHNRIDESRYSTGHIICHKVVMKLA